MATLYKNPAARSYTTTSASTPAIQSFHSTLPHFSATPLIPLASLASSLGLPQLHLLLKDETSRLSLPSFKILGASWGAHRAVCSRFGLAPDTTALSQLPANLCLVAATDGNHGRAVAHVARLLPGGRARIFVPAFVDLATRTRIEAEGAEVVVCGGADYDEAVRRAAEAAEKGGELAVLVQDTAWDGYEDVPQWIVSGYTTLLHELSTQLPSLTNRAHPTHIIVPVGVGSLAQAVLEYYRSLPAGVTPPTILTVEPETASPLYDNLVSVAATATPATVQTGATIMTGLHCGTVSSLAWPKLRAGVDAATVVSDREAHWAVEKLRAEGVRAGPCGAATLAALVKVKEGLGLEEGSVVVLLCTEGEREYVVPN